MILHILCRHCVSSQHTNAQVSIINGIPVGGTGREGERRGGEGEKRRKGEREREGERGKRGREGGEGEEGERERGEERERGDREDSKK